MENTVQGEQKLEEYSKLLLSIGTRLGLIHLSPAQVSEQLDRSLGVAAFVSQFFGSSPPGDLSVIDVGSGAGLPAIPMAIAFEQLGRERPPAMTLIEPRRKAVAFLEKVLRDLDLPCSVLPERAEVAARGRWRGRGDFVTAKALAEPIRALELCAPLCKIGGVIVLTGKSEAGGGRAESASGFETSKRQSPDWTTLSITGPAGVSGTVHVVRKSTDPGGRSP